MPESPLFKTRTGQILLVVAAVVLLGVLVAMLLNGGSKAGGSTQGANTEVESPSAGPSNPSKRESRPWKSGSAGSGESGEADSEASPVVDQWMDEHWDEPDDKLISGLLDFTGRSDLGLAEKSQALDHALNLLPDTEYGKLDALLLDPGTPAQLVEKIFTDLHNRSEKASLQAALHLIKRAEPEIVAAAKALMAHLLDLDEENELEAIRLQAETRVIELNEEEPPDEDVVEMDPKEPIPEGLIDATVPPPEE